MRAGVLLLLLAAVALAYMKVVRYAAKSVGF